MSGPGAGDEVVIGLINGVWGVQGWVKVYSWTEPTTSLFDYQPWYLGDERRAVSVIEWRQQGPRLVARLEGVETAEAAASLVDQSICIPVAALPAPRPGQYYWHDLIGLNVVNLDGEQLGRIDAMLPTGANDVMDVLAASGRHHLIPFVIDRYVRTVDLRGGRVIVDWPAEWLE
jgi:16S rRNA processing protein RimM